MTKNLHWCKECVFLKKSYGFLRTQKKVFPVSLNLDLEFEVFLDRSNLDLEKKVFLWVDLILDLPTSVSYITEKLFFSPCGQKHLNNTYTSSFESPMSLQKWLKWPNNDEKLVFLIILGYFFVVILTFSWNWRFDTWWAI